MKTCEIRIGHGRHTRWIRAYHDVRRNPFCIDCARRLHPEIYLNPTGGRGSVYFPIYENDRQEMFKILDSRCCGPGFPHGVLCDAQTERRIAQEAQGNFAFVAQFGKRFKNKS